MNQPSSSSTSPRTWSATLKEWPWRRAQLWPGATMGQKWAASKVNSLKISIGLVPHPGGLADAGGLVGLEADSPLRVCQAVFHHTRNVGVDLGAVHGLQVE